MAVFEYTGLQIANGKQVKGVTKEKLGKFTGNRDLEQRGKQERSEGKVQEKVGKARRKVGEAVEDLDWELALR